MSGHNDVDVFVTLHATFNSAYLQRAYYPLVDVPPDPGPPRTNTAVLPVEATPRGTQVKINPETFLQIQAFGDVELTRIDNHITVHPPGHPRPVPFFAPVDDGGVLWQQPNWMRDRMREQIHERDHNDFRPHWINDQPPEYQMAAVNIVPVHQFIQQRPPPLPFRPMVWNPPVVEMGNMNINRRPNEHDRMDDDEEDEAYHRGGR